MGMALKKVCAKRNINEALLKVQNPRHNDSILAEFACPGTLYLIKSHCYIIPANLAASEVHVLCQHYMHY